MQEITKFAHKTAERKAKIIQATAGLIIKDGIGTLTHRRVAAAAGVPLGSTTQHFASLDELKSEALKYLGEKVNEQNRQGELILAKSQDIAADITQIMIDYMSDITNAQMEAAFYVSSIEHPELRPLTTRWFNGLVEILTHHMTHESAQAIAMFADGVMLYILTHEAQIDKDFLRTTIHKLMEHNDV